MTFVRVTPSKTDGVKALLGAHAEYAMFPLNNLVQFGLDGQDPLAPRMWRNADGPLRDVMTVTKAGMVLPFLPSGEYEGAAAVLSGRTLIGIVGPAAAARGIQNALGLADTAMELDADEGHFNLSLSDLKIPDGKTRLVPAWDMHRAVLTDWLEDYHISILGMSPDQAAKVVPEWVTRDISEKRRMMLMGGDTPVATTAFNAALPDIVQIGGVYTPPSLRGRGYARRAVALHLAQVRAEGVRKATLFANDPSAIAAYTAVGFNPIGDWVLSIFQTPQEAP